MSLPTELRILQILENAGKIKILTQIVNELGFKWCPGRDDFVFSFALKISILYMSKNFVLDKVSLKIQQHYFLNQRYKF